MINAISNKLAHCAPEMSCLLSPPFVKNNVVNEYVQLLS